MTEDNKEIQKGSWFSKMFHHSSPQLGVRSAEQAAAADTIQPTVDDETTTTATPAIAELGGDNSVAEWLDHPVGGAIFRDMLRQSGQDEGVLRVVRRLPFKRLIAMSGGRFTEDMLNEMIRKVEAGEVPVIADAATAPAEPISESATQPSSSEAPLPVWQEKIMPGRFSGKTIIVTGAGSGIGRATASRVAREGGRVIGVDISQERLDAFKNSLPDQDITVIAGDITNDDAIRQIVENAGDQIDGLANVAGIMDNMTPLHEVSDEIWNKVFAVNVTGMMKLTRAVLPRMLDAHSGSIVNVGSEASLRGSAAGVAYTAAKHAVVGLTKSSAFIYGPGGIRVNCVAPGGVLTNIEATFDSELGKERVNTMLSVAPETVEADVLAASITFLLSDDATNLNGVILPSDGGWSVQ